MDDGWGSGLWADCPYVLPGPLPLARSTVDRATERRLDPDYLKAVWDDPSSRVLVVGDGHVSVNSTDGAGLAFVPPEDAPSGERYFLGVDDDVAYLAVHVQHAPDQGATLREAGTTLTDRDAGLAVHAIALSNWHENHSRCPKCGGVTTVEQGGHIRRCLTDGSEHYPRTDPAVIVLVVDENDRCLLGRAKQWTGNRFSTLAGFVEPGEAPEHAVVREIMEEAGIAVSSCTYAGSQPWPFPSSLMLGYYATAQGDQPTPDGDELVDARWFSRADLRAAIEREEVAISPGVSIARHLIDGWLHAD